jgi:hypothetical protein
MLHLLISRYSPSNTMVFLTKFVSKCSFAVQDSNIQLTIFFRPNWLKKFVECWQISRKAASTRYEVNTAVEVWIHVGVLQKMTSEKLIIFSYVKYKFLFV